jgi:hypothetical protein
LFGHKKQNRGNPNGMPRFYFPLPEIGDFLRDIIAKINLL